jgi:hypothetical protein
MTDTTVGVIQKLQSAMTRTLKLSHHYVVNPVIDFEVAEDAPQVTLEIVDQVIAELEGRGRSVATPVITRQTAGDTPLMTLIEGLEGDFDVIITTGFGDTVFPKLVICADIQKAICQRFTNAIGYISDGEADAWMPAFSPGNAAAIATKIEEHIIEPYLASREISFTANRNKTVEDVADE